MVITQVGGLGVVAQFELRELLVLSTFLQRLLKKEDVTGGVYLQGEVVPFEEFKAAMQNLVNVTSAVYKRFDLQVGNATPLADMKPDSELVN